MKGILIQTNGVVKPVKDISLRAMQVRLGGMIDVFTPHGIDVSVFVLDDAYGQSLNVVAGSLFGYPIVGDCIVTGGVDHLGYTKPLSKEVAQVLLTFLQK